MNANMDLFNKIIFHSKNDSNKYYLIYDINKMTYDIHYVLSGNKISFASLLTVINNFKFKSWIPVKWKDGFTYCKVCHGI